MVKKKKLIIILVVVILLIIGASFLIQQTITGSSLLSLTQVNLKSSSLYLDGKQWVYTLRAGGLTQYAEGKVTPDDVSDYSDKIPEEKLEIDTEFRQYCKHKLVEDKTQPAVEKLSVITWTYIPFVNPCTESEGEERGCTGEGWIGQYTGTLTCFCIHKTSPIYIGSRSQFYSPDIESEMNIILNAKGITQKTTLSSNKAIKGAVGSRAYAIWQGNLDTGKACSLPTSEIIPILIGGNWKLASHSRYDDYKSYINIFEEFIEGGIPTKSKITSKVDDWNDRADAVKNLQFTFGTIQNSYIKRDVKSLIQYPVITLYVKADWLGIVTPIPDFSIVELDTECFGAGERGYIETKIKNSGERGEANIYATCDSGFSTESQNLFIDKESTETISLILKAVTDEEEAKGNCKVCVEGIEETECKNIEVCVTGKKICTLGNRWCEGNKLYVCNDEFKEPELEKECKGECIDKGKGDAYCEGDETICKTDKDCDDNNPNTIDRCEGILKKTCRHYPKGECEAWWSVAGYTIIPNLSLTCLGISLTTPLKIIMLIIGSLIAFAFAYTKLPFKEKDKKLKTIVAVILGILAGVLIWFYWWILLLVLGLVIIGFIILKIYL